MTSFRKSTQTLLGWKVIISGVAALVVAISCLTVLAQSGAGSIQGTVTDSTGAVIPGASIHVVNQATGVAVHTKSNSTGFYQVPGLFAGTYVVTITAPRMKTSVRTIDLLVAQSAVINATMTPGAVTEQVNVVASDIQLTNNADGSIGSTLDNARIDQLPMDGRDLLTLINEVTPGMDACSQSPSCANGLMPSATGLTVDGVTLTSGEFGGANAGQSAMPDPDSVQEVKMVTNGAGAQYTTPATGMLTTKSGTNQIHGSLFETARNNAWGIAKQRQDPANYAAPQYIRNEFGGTIGGPIVIPHLYHGKDKSFWFFSYERYSLAQVSYTETTVPTTAMRSGDFSNLVNSTGTLQQLYDPATTAPNTVCPATGKVSTQWCRTPFPTSASGAPNQVPMSRISPFAQFMFAVTPQPTTNDNPLIANNFDNPGHSYKTIPNVTFRLDHVFNENNRAYLRYTSEFTTNINKRNGSQITSLAATVNGTNFPAELIGEANSPTTLFATSIGYTHVFSPSFFSETILSQQWMNLGNYAAGPSPNIDVSAELGLPNNFGLKGFPSVNASLETTNGTQYQYDYSQIFSKVDENLTKLWQKHQMQFGGRFGFERFTYWPNQLADAANFGNQTTGLENPKTNTSLTYTAYPNTGYGTADLFLGGASLYQVAFDAIQKEFHDMEIDGYFQDNYHAARNLTFNLGLRWEAHPAPKMKDGAMTGFDLKNDALVLGEPTSTLIAKGYTTQAIITNYLNDGANIETPQQANQPPAMIDNYNLNFLPRAGFAWQLPWRWGTILRGAYGRFIYPIPQYFAMDSVTGAGPLQGNFQESYSAANQAPDGLPNYLLRSTLSSASNPPFGVPPIAGLNSANAVNSNTTNGILPGVTFDALDTDLPPDYVTQANVTIEQPMKGNSALRVSYVFAHDANLWNFYQFNNHPSPYVWEMQTGTTPPNGNVIGTPTYSATSTGPYDKAMWGSGMRLIQKTGWSTDNALQVDYLKLFHHGVGWQISYLWSKPMHTGGETGGDGITYPSADYIYSAVSTMTNSYPVTAPLMPKTPPAGTLPWQYYRDLNRFQNYRVDTQMPLQEIKFNGIVDLPVGRGKWLLHNANRFINELVGGWQLAGDGNIHSQDFNISSANWGPTNPIQLYKHKMPVEDCRSGNCFKEYEWFNGWVAPTANANAACTKNCLSGLTGNWTSYETPIGTSGTGSNDVNITLPGKAPATIAYSPGPSTNPFAHTTLNGPFYWNANVSLFKAFLITERVRLRFNMDSFNAFNHQGQANPNATDGTTPCTVGGGVGCSSPNAAREVQFTLRLTF